MVGGAGMGPQPIDISKLKFADENEEQTRQRVMNRFERIGLTLMNRTRGSADTTPIRSPRSSPTPTSAPSQVRSSARRT